MLLPDYSSEIFIPVVDRRSAEKQGKKKNNHGESHSASSLLGCSRQGWPQPIIFLHLTLSSASSSLTITSCPSRNLLFALLLSLLPANSNLGILLLMFSLPLLCTCPSNLTLALTPEHPTCGASFLVQSVLVSFEMKHKYFYIYAFIFIIKYFSYLPPVSTSVPPASLNIKDHTELPFNVCFTTALHVASALIQVFKPSLTHFAPCKLVEAWLCHTGLYA